MSRMHIPTYIGLLNFTSSFRNSTAIKFSEKNTSAVEIRFRDHCLRTISPFPMCQKFYIHMVSYIFHSFIEYRVVHQFVQIFFEIVCRACSKTCVEFDVIAESGGLSELKHAMYLCNTKTVTCALLQVAIIDNITLLIIYRRE